ncbi:MULTISPECIES: ABC transporter permease [unclassified Streptomyces]|uniref:ABC transporter permease n=1 Tax=unclassified Streptomyces TaxID=2593676 RepID=UPI002E773F1A|nr:MULTISPECIES: ABC transporter permease [unclassified Streptomyces]MEE1762009.1 ABC transporter permease [Streptomyces sp. SP18BB07]MEE1835503.1 ABC transporter permease [Streptomyces sp. SP17KL33]
MSRRGEAFRTALWFEVVGHGRNRLAITLAVGFLPFQNRMFHAVARPGEIRFRLGALSRDVVAVADHVNQLSGALHAVTMIVGLTMFMASFKTGAFDRRLVLAGFPRTSLVAARFVGLCTVSALLALYAALVQWLAWPVERFWGMTLALFVAGLVYGGLGILLGALVRGELEGMFTVVMASLVDMGLQNPITNPAADQSGLWALPSYGPVQAATAAGVTATYPVAHLLLGLVWAVTASAAGLLAFAVRTWSYAPSRTGPARVPRQREGGPRASADTP